MYVYYFDYAAILIFLIIAGFYFPRKHVNNQLHKLFCAMYADAVCITLFDIIGGHCIDYHASASIVYTTNIIYYISCCVIVALFALYVFAHLNLHHITSVFQHIVFVLPIVVMLGVILSTPFTGWLFSYSTDHVWTTGPALYVLYGEYGIYYIIAIIYCITHRNNLDKSFRTKLYLIVALNFIPLIQTVIIDALTKGFITSVSLLILLFDRMLSESVIDLKTGMANGQYMNDTVKKYLYNSHPFTMVLVRIGDFNVISTCYGTETANKLNITIASYLSALVKRGHAFKIGMASYGLLFEGKDPELLVNTIYHNLDQSWHVENVDVSPQFFITYLPYPEHIQNLDDFTAHVTYFDAVQRVRYGIIHESELQVRDYRRENDIIAAIHNGLKNGNYQIYYQPIYDTRTGRFLACEALSRLYDPKLGNIPPMEFITLAETNGLIIPIGFYVIEEVCKFIANHDLDALGLKYIELNLSVIQGLQRDFIPKLIRLTDQYKIDPSRLCFEITETASDFAPQILADNLSKLKALGYKLALDDFGSGYSNFERMITTEYDYIKFDKEMIQKVLSEKRVQKAYEKMQTVLHSMNSKIIAEGVEEKAGYEYLRRIGCDYIQGYYFSQALPEEEYIDFLLHEQAKRAKKAN